jgi:hypothetical protein
MNDEGVNRCSYTGFTPFTLKAEHEMREIQEAYEPLTGRLRRKVKIMKKIVLAAHPDHESTEWLVRLIETIFPECEVHVTPAQPGFQRNKEEAGPAV